MMCYEEALRARREVVSKARNDPDLFHLFGAVVWLHSRSRMFLLKKEWIKLRLSLNVWPAEPTTTCLSNTPTSLPVSLPSSLPDFLTS